ncbi:hypothetical protein Tco_1568461 [Tanacetum coccineum]
MADKGKKSSMEIFAPNDKAYYYSGITSITVNGKNAYELKGKFLNDLHNNAFSGTNGKDASDKEEETVEIFKIETDVFYYETPLCLAFSDFNYLLKVNPELLTKDIMGFKTYKDYKDDWIYEWNENVPWVYDKPWLDNGIWKEPKPVRHDCKPFNYKTGCSEWPTCSWREGGYCNGGNLPGAYHIGNSLHYQDYECYDALIDCELKEQALRNKDIIEGSISDNESTNDGWRRWESHKINYHDHDEIEYENETHDERQELCEADELPVCNMRRLKMIKYSFGLDEEYVAVKEDEYEDLAKTSDDACRTYQEIFRMMDERWMDLVKEISTNIGGEFTNLEILKCWSLETSRMSTPVFVDPGINTQANGAQSSQVPVPLPEDPYEAIRQAYLVGTDTESEPFEDPVETKTPKSPHTVASLTLLPDSTPPTCHVEESEGSDTSGARFTSSDSTAPLSPNHQLTHTTPTLVPILRSTARMVVRVPPVMSPGLSSSIAEVVAMSDSAFLEDDDEEEDDEEEIEESSDSDSESEDAEDEGPTAEDEDPTVGDEGLAAGDEGLGMGVESFGLGRDEGVPEGQQRAAPVVETTMGQGSGSVPESERPKRVSALTQPTLTTGIDPEDGKAYIDVHAYPPPAPPV